jgi:hypothetical protein
VRAGAAVLVYRGSHGGVLPESLGAALSPLPTDPFDGKPLHYRRDGAGFVVYSVGPDGKFDGGAPEAKLSSGNATLMFRYPLLSSGITPK